MDNEIVNLEEWFKEMFISQQVAHNMVANAGVELEEWNDNALEFNEEHAEDIENEEACEMREADREDISEWMEEGWHDFWFGEVDEWVNDKWAVGQLFYLDDEGTTPVMLMVASPEEDGCQWQVAGNPKWLTTYELFDEMGNPEKWEWWDEELAHPRNSEWVAEYVEMGVI